MRVLFVTLSLLLLALAGCTDSGASEDGTGEGTENAGGVPAGETSEGSGSGEVVGGPFNATVPVALMTVIVPPGLAPVDVSFNISIEGFVDPDFADWTLDVNSDGETESDGFGGLPFNYTQTFTAGGNFTATFTADDGQGSAEAMVNFTVVAAPVIPPEPPLTISGTTQLPCALLVGCWDVGAAGCVGYLADTNEIDCVFGALDENQAGRSFETSAPFDLDLEFFDTCGGTSVRLFNAAGNDSGIVPAGAGCVVLMDGVLAGELSITISG